MKTLAQQIQDTQSSLRRARPRSNLALKLQIRLRDLVVRELKKENMNHRASSGSRSPNGHPGTECAA